MFSEWIMRIAIILFFSLTVFGLSVYNPGMRQYLEKFIDIDTKFRYTLVSITPFFISFFVSSIYPNVLGIFWIIGLI